MFKMSKSFVLSILIFTFFAFTMFMSADTAEASWWDNYVVSGWNKVTDLFEKGENSQDIASEDSMPDYLKQNWNKLTDNLSELLRREDQQDDLPDSKWFGFGDDKKSNAEEINKLMDAALEILMQGRATDLRRETATLRANIPHLRAEMDRLRNERITAPRDANWQLWKQTQNKIDNRIAELQQEIQASESRLEALNAELSETLRSLNLNLDKAQVDVLMNSVTGDDLLQNVAVFANIKIVAEQLEELARNDHNDLEINRRYAGMYLVLNDILIHTQREVIYQITEKYKPQLAKIRQEAENLRNVATIRSNQSKYSESQKAVFAKNAETNAMTVKVADLYTQLLDKQQRDFTENIRKLQFNRDAAENTYKTVKNSGELRGVIQNGLTLFDSIQDISAMPELQVFVDSNVMRLEFEEINKRLKSN